MAAEANCRLLTAGDGAAALQILGSHHADVVVSDVRTPVMDGVLQLKDLTTNVDLSKGSHPPKTIFISFRDLEPREAYGLRVEAILQKPIDRVRLADTV
jgi:CheY-like chemotaxis protein